MQAILSIDCDTYRAFKYTWVGLPKQPPDLFTQAVWDRGEIITLVYVSWNGATNVHTWIFKALNKGGIEFLGEAERTGFETSFVHHGYATHVFAEAFDDGGHVLGKSGTLSTIRPTAVGVDFRRRLIEAEEGEAQVTVACSMSCLVKGFEALGPFLAYVSVGIALLLLWRRIRSRRRIVLSSKLG